MVILKGSRTRDTYNDLFVIDRIIASVWGKVTNIELPLGEHSYFVRLNRTETFLYRVDKIILNDLGTKGITFEIGGELDVK